MFAGRLALSINLPSWPVEVALSDPLTVTVAPEMANPLASVTLPEIWAYVITLKTSDMKRIQLFFITTCFVVGYKLRTKCMGNNYNNCAARKVVNGSLMQVTNVVINDTP